MNKSLEDYSDEEIVNMQLKRKVLEDKKKSSSKRRKHSVSHKKETKFNGKNTKVNGKFCGKCAKKLRLMSDFTCRCGGIFCAMHRFYDQHGCTFDYRTKAIAKLDKMNPKIVNDKITRF